MLPSESKTPTEKGRKRSVSEILRKAYSLHCRDKATRHALRIHLRDA